MKIQQLHQKQQRHHQLIAKRTKKQQQQQHQQQHQHQQINKGINMKILRRNDIRSKRRRPSWSSASAGFFLSTAVTNVNAKAASNMAATPNLATIKSNFYDKNIHSEYILAGDYEKKDIMKNELNSDIGHFDSSLTNVGAKDSGKDSKRLLALIEDHAYFPNEKIASNLALQTTLAPQHRPMFQQNEEEPGPTESLTFATAPVTFILSIQTESLLLELLAKEADVVLEEYLQNSLELGFITNNYVQLRSVDLTVQIAPEGKARRSLLKGARNLKEQGSFLLNVNGLAGFQVNSRFVDPQDFFMQVDDILSKAIESELITSAFQQSNTVTLGNARIQEIGAKVNTNTLTSTVKPSPLDKNAMMDENKPKKEKPTLLEMIFAFTLIALLVLSLFGYAYVFWKKYKKKVKRRRQLGMQGPGKKMNITYTPKRKPQTSDMNTAGSTFTMLRPIPDDSSDDDDDSSYKGISESEESGHGGNESEQSAFSKQLQQAASMDKRAWHDFQKQKHRIAEERAMLDGKNGSWKEKRLPASSSLVYGQNCFSVKGDTVPIQHTSSFPYGDEDGDEQKISNYNAVGTQPYYYNPNGFEVELGRDDGEDQWGDEYLAGRQKKPLATINEVKQNDAATDLWGVSDDRSNAEANIQIRETSAFPDTEKRTPSIPSASQHADTSDIIKEVQRLSQFVKSYEKKKGEKNHKLDQGSQSSATESLSPSTASGRNDMVKQHKTEKSFVDGFTEGRESFLDGGQELDDTFSISRSTVTSFDTRGMNCSIDSSTLSSWPTQNYTSTTDQARNEIGHFINKRKNNDKAALDDKTLRELQNLRTKFRIREAEKNKSTELQPTDLRNEDQEIPSTGKQDQDWTPVSQFLQTVQPIVKTRPTSTERPIRLQQQQHQQQQKFHHNNKHHRHHQQQNQRQRKIQQQPRTSFLDFLDGVALSGSLDVSSSSEEMTVETFDDDDLSHRIGISRFSVQLHSHNDMENQDFSRENDPQKYSAGKITQQNQRQNVRKNENITREFEGEPVTRPSSSTSSERFSSPSRLHPWSGDARTEDPSRVTTPVHTNSRKQNLSSSRLQSSPARSEGHTTRNVSQNGYSSPFSGSNQSVRVTTPVHTNSRKQNLSSARLQSSPARSEGHTTRNVNQNGYSSPFSGSNQSIRTNNSFGSVSAYDKLNNISNVNGIQRTVYEDKNAVENSFSGIRPSSYSPFSSSSQQTPSRQQSQKKQQHAQSLHVSPSPTVSSSHPTPPRSDSSKFNNIVSMFESKEKDAIFPPNESWQYNC